MSSINFLLFVRLGENKNLPEARRWAADSLMETRRRKGARGETAVSILVLGGVDR